MVKIIADSTCDLSPELLQKYDIDVLPLHIVLGEEEYLDGQGITPDEIYRWADEHKSTPKTAAISTDTAMELYKRYIDQDCEVVSFAISSHMSTTGNVMQLAAEMLGVQDRVHVIDSQNLSTGIGLLVLEAAEMARQGSSAAQIVARMEELKPRVRASFVVDTLTYLHRGGRCSGVAALLGGTLKLHPQISVKDGKMQAGKKFRGRMDAVIKHYVADMEDDLRTARKARVFITHSGCSAAVLESVRGQLQALNHFDEILITRAGGVISSHCGPGTLGVLFIAGQ